jgi:hypothetical protein
MNDVDDDANVHALFAALKRALPTLQALRDDFATQWGDEDGVYRFYHQSFKVYGLQRSTLAIVQALQALAPDRELNKWFAQIVADGTGKRFESEHNKRWLEVTRPMVEAFFHARYFLEMALKYGNELDAPPRTLPSGWAAFLYLYNLR